MRLFVAVDVPDDVRGDIESEVVDELRDRVPGARWTRPEGRHLTLKFLGNVDVALVPKIAGAVATAAAAHAPFEASFVDLGGFPSLRRPRVLWIGVRDGAEEMAALAGSIESAVEPLGFEREGRPFRGHLTLARFPKPQAVDVPAVAVPKRRFAVREVTMFESRLHPKGAQYTAVDRFALKR